MKDLKNLSDLLVYEVQGLYNTEKWQVAALERMMGKASSQELKSALQQHLEETKNHKQRLEEVAEIMKVDPTDEGSWSIKGLLVEGEKILHKDATPETLDAAIISGVQKVEHLEIACYGTAAQLAKELGMSEVEQILAQSLEEEKTTDAKLSQIAITSINRRSEMAGV